MCWPECGCENSCRSMSDNLKETMMPHPFFVELDERHKEILNLDNYIDFGLGLKDNMLKLWQLSSLGQKRHIQNFVFPEGFVWNKKNDDIEPLSKNEFFFQYPLKSMGYEEKKNGQTVISDDLSALAPQVGLEPTTP